MGRKILKEALGEKPFLKVFRVLLCGDSVRFVFRLPFKFLDSLYSLRLKQKGFPRWPRATTKVQPTSSFSLPLTNLLKTATLRGVLRKDAWRLFKEKILLLLLPYLYYSFHSFLIG